jgi:hypothetical protein
MVDYKFLVIMAISILVMIVGSRLNKKNRD